MDKCYNVIIRVSVYSTSPQRDGINNLFIEDYMSLGSLLSVFD